MLVCNQFHFKGLCLSMFFGLSFSWLENVLLQCADPLTVMDGIILLMNNISWVLITAPQEQTVSVSCTVYL